MGKIGIGIERASIGVGLGKLNLKQYKKNKEKHIEVCKSLVELSKKHGNFPYGALVYFAVGKDAHHTAAFKDGYKNVDVQKAETIIEWMKMLSEYHNKKRFRTDGNAAHALTKFYEKVSTKTEDFKAALERSPKIVVDKTNHFADIVSGLGM